MQGLRAAFFSVVLLTCPVGAAAQTAAEVLDDVDTFREALDGTVHANVRIEAATPVDLRMRAARDGLTFVDAGGRERTVRVDDATLPFEQRLLAAMLVESPLAEALAGLEMTFGEQWLSYAVFEPPGIDPVLVRRIGTAAAWLAVEPGIARPRELRVRRPEGLYQVRVPAYSDLASGWFPEQVEVYLDDQLLLALTVSDVAPDPGALAPLPVSTAAPRVRFPRLPL